MAIQNYIFVSASAKNESDHKFTTTAHLLPTDALVAEIKAVMSPKVKINTLVLNWAEIKLLGNALETIAKETGLTIMSDTLIYQDEFTIAWVEPKEDDD